MGGKAPEVKIEEQPKGRDRIQSSAKTAKRVTPKNKIQAEGTYCQGISQLSIVV